MKVLHVLANGPPDVNGYAIRTQKILENLPDKVVGLTSPWYPYRDSMVFESKINGIHYHRTIHPLHRIKKIPISHKVIRFLTKKELNNASQSVNGKKKPASNIFVKAIRAPGYFARIGWKVAEEKILIKYFTKRIIEVAKEEKVDILHAHTPYRVGLPALKAARKLKIPFVYEMRGMWEETAVANGRWMRNGPAYRRFQSYETKVLRKADQVICISETLKNEAIRRGVSAEKISIVTNAVERKMLEQNKSSALYPTVTERLEKNPDACTVGYIGSLRAMEGVDLTARAVAQLVQKGVKVQFFVLTGESGQAELRQLCKELGIENFSTIVGPVPHDEVATFYSLIDVFVVSRPSSRVTQLVTPLKPFEAMAMGRTVVASKLAALEEIIQHEKTGLLYKPDDLNDLADTIELCVQQPEKRQEIGRAAQQWVLENRTWDVVVKNTKEVYNRLEI